MTSFMNETSMNIHDISQTLRVTENFPDDVQKDLHVFRILVLGRR